MYCARSGPRRLNDQSGARGSELRETDLKDRAAAPQQKICGPIPERCSSTSTASDFGTTGDAEALRGASEASRVGRMEIPPPVLFLLVQVIDAARPHDATASPCANAASKPLEHRQREIIPFPSREPDASVSWPTFGAGFLPRTAVIGCLRKWRHAKRKRLAAVIG